MSCYFLAQISIHDRDEYQKYLDGFDEIFARYKGIVVAVDEAPTILEGSDSFSRRSRGQALVHLPRVPGAREAQASLFKG